MNRTINLFPIFILALALTSCDHEVSTTSILNEDGSVEKSVRFKKTSETNEHSNSFGLSPDEWNITVDSSGKDEYIRFVREFETVDDANLLLDQESDSLFKIHSEFHKSFRWFYSYIYYSDTYRAINRFRHLPADYYLTPEDLAFIERLPAEGKSISIADSLFLEDLGTKIYEQYLVTAFIEEHVNILEYLIRTHNLDTAFLEKLDIEKGVLMKKIEDGFEIGEDLEEDLALIMADSLGLQLPDAALNQYPLLLQDLTARMDFMTWANDGEFSHYLTVPWELIETNADTVDGNTLMWNPPVMKLLFTDYEMYAVVRKMNYWAVALSGLVVLVAIFLMFPRKKKQSNAVH